MIIKAPVSDVFNNFNRPMEGRLNFPYLDRKGLITTGVGNLCNDANTFTAIPWTINGAPATLAEKLRWMHGLWDLPKATWEFGGGWFKNKTPLRITDVDIDRMVAAKMLQMAKYMQNNRRWAFQDFCCDAQLGLLSMSWAMGPAFKFPKFEGCLLKGDWEGCADHCAIANPKKERVLELRNLYNKKLFLNAHFVQRYGHDPEKLYYPEPLGLPPEGVSE